MAPITGPFEFRGSAGFATERHIDRPLLQRRGFRRGIINRVAPQGHYLEVPATEVAKYPPLSARATVRTRPWYMDQLEREVDYADRPFEALPR